VGHEAIKVMSLLINYQHRYQSFRLNIELQIPAKQCIAIFGDSGAGKSSLLEWLAGFTDHIGTLVFDDKIIQDSLTNRPSWQREFAYIQQQNQLFTHLTAEQNIEYATKRSDLKQQACRLKEVCQLLEITELMDKFPSELSGGQRQLVAIAQALASSPKLLMLDEPVSAIDERKRFEVLLKLKAYCTKHQITMIFVSHDRREVSLIADYLVMISNGQVSAQGKFETLATDVTEGFAKSAAAITILPVLVTDERQQGLQKVDYHGQALWLHYQPSFENYVGIIRPIEIPANELSISLKPLIGSSIINCLSVTIESFELVSSGQMIVEVYTGYDKLLVSITLRSFESLQLKVGVNCYVQFKALARVY
jgi:molybdate transport system ATP-binding protein